LTDSPNAPAENRPSRWAPLVYRPPTDPWLSHLHVDDDLIVLDKPSGLLTVSGKAEGLEDCLAARAEGEWPGARIVHRLDMDTSGVIVLARNAAAHRHLGMQFEKRQTRKSYVARVAGRMAEDEGLVDLPLRCDWENRPLQMVCHEEGRAAQTNWIVTAREEDATRVELMPVTGRSHQLRVHMLTLGHPILGDPFYGDRESAPRLQLHAETLYLRHPTGGAWHGFHAPCPF